MFAIPLARPGRLWIMPYPRDLPRDIAGWQAARMTHVLSMLEPAEADQLGLTRERALCEAAGIAFHSHPIADFSLPDPVAFADLIAGLSTMLKVGAGVGVHCRGGIGRSGMVCTCLLIDQGHSPAQAIADVALARRVAVPDTAEQAAFIADFARRG